MATNIVAFDARLKGKTPTATSGAISIFVDADTPLDEFFRLVDRESLANRGLDTLYILANLVYVPVDDVYAIQFCREYISGNTMNRFFKLRDKVKKIVLFVCAGEDTDTPTRGEHDFNHAELARHAKAEVVVARSKLKKRPTDEEELFFCDGSVTEFGEWEGTVSRYNERGQLVTEYHEPDFFFEGLGTHNFRADEDPMVLRRRKGLANEGLPNHSF